MNYLVNVVETWRVPTNVEADVLEAEFRADGVYTLTNIVKTDKEIKEKGEVVETYVLVKATKIFNAVKEPDSDVRPSYK